MSTSCSSMRAALGLQARQFQQVVEQRLHLARLVLHAVNGIGHFIRAVVANRLQVADQHGQRCAQLVRHVGDKIAAHLLEVVEVGDVALRISSRCSSR